MEAMLYLKKKKKKKIFVAKFYIKKPIDLKDAKHSFLSPVLFNKKYGYDFQTKQITDCSCPQKKYSDFFCEKKNSGSEREKNIVPLKKS